MLKTLNVGGRILLKSRRISTNKRKFLSEAYRCDEAWNRRFESALLQKINLNNMFLDVQQKIINDGKVSAIDVDILSNIVKGGSDVEKLLSVIHDLRLSPETSNTLDSTHHAVIRYLLNNNASNELLMILHDRLNYGIFPDSYLYNLLMDTFIKQKNYASAAKVAVLLMLQEDAAHPISNSLCIYSCHKYLENPSDWQVSTPSEDPDDKEEIKVRVGFLRNPYFDDHFDLTDPRDLVGKTLAFQGKHIDNALGRSCLLRGLILYKKFNLAQDFIDKWVDSKVKEVVYEEIFNLIEKDQSVIPEDQQPDEYKNLKLSVEKLKQMDLCKGSMIEIMEKNIRSAIEQVAEKDISEKQEAFIRWEEERLQKLEEQKQMIDRKLRLDKISVIKQELAKEEEIITFFDREEEIEMAIEEKLANEQKDEEFLNKAVKLAKVEEEYIPPEIRQRKQ